MTNKQGWNAGPEPKLLIDDQEEGEVLQISWDADHDPADYKQWSATFYYSPGPGEHFNISLSQEQAKSLNKWLVKFLTKVKSDE